jgi:hypothetical protein
MAKKAHTTVVNRLKSRYGGESLVDGVVDLVANDMLIAVESSATLVGSIEQLLALEGLRYIAVTNRESLDDALHLCNGTPLGVMNSQGDIVKQADE